MTTNTTIALSPTELDKLEALARAATPGPWNWWTSNSVLRLTGADDRDGGVLHAYARGNYGDISCPPANQAFIAAANPATILTLVAQARAAQPAKEKCRGCDPAEGFCRDCRDAEKARAAQPTESAIWTAVARLERPDSTLEERMAAAEGLRAALPAAVGAELPEGLLDELIDAVIEAFNGAAAIKDWSARDHWRDVLAQFEDWRAAQQQQAGAAAPIDDLVQRLREHNDERLYQEADVLMAEAADAIADLRAQLAAAQSELDDWLHTNRMDVLQREVVELRAQLARQGQSDASSLLRELADAADTVMRGGIAGLRPAIDKAHAYLASPAQASAAQADELPRIIRAGLDMKRFIASHEEGAAAEQARAVSPEGWKLVPPAVTKEMQEAYFKVIDKNIQRVTANARFGRWDSMREAYVAMLAASPTVPAQPVAAAADAGGLTDEAILKIAADVGLKVRTGQGAIRFARALLGEAPTTTSAAAQPVAKVGESAAARDVLAERRRQVEQEGWTPEHDNQYAGGILPLAASCYALAGDLPRGTPPREWPWADWWWKPTNHRRNLIKAGALILAEIERIDRAAMQSTTTGATDGAVGGEHAAK